MVERRRRQGARARGDPPGRTVRGDILSFFGLAHDGRTDAKGMPHFLQLVLFALEFDDVIRFTPPRLSAGAAARCQLAARLEAAERAVRLTGDGLKLPVRV